MRPPLSIRVGCLLLILTGPLPVGSSRAPAAGLTAAEQDGYLIWLHALEETVAGREAAGQPEIRPLYPRLEPLSASWSPEGLLDVARALEEIESRPRLLQEPAGASSLHALNRARNHLHLAQYDSALVWFAEAAARDSQGTHGDELGRLAMAAAAAVRSDEVVAGRLDELRRRPDLTGQAAELEIGFRYLLARSDTLGVQDLVDALQRREDELTGRLRYWQAFGLNWLGRWSESLAHLRRLLLIDGHSHGLDEGQRAWVLVAVPDQILLLGDRKAAQPLYRALAASTVPEASVWAACQDAACDLLDGRFLDAGTALERLCSRKENEVWRQYACRLAELSDELERLRNEGRSHGADAYYQP